MKRLFTVGHSNLAAPALLEILGRAGVQHVGDVRRFPASRRHPQFSRDALAAALRQTGIGYVHLPDLGGRREPRPDSPHAGWREAGFRGYADWMETAAFARALAQLLRLAGEQPLAMLCAEADWRNCHRGLIADALKLRGWDVLHLGPASGCEPHPWTAPARIVAGRLRYPAEAPVQRSLDL
jgi:uncharacterized protein (DUF488 family)